LDAELFALNSCELSTGVLHIAKKCFRVNEIDAVGQVTLRRKLNRNEEPRFFEAQPMALVSIESFSTSHHWARVPPSSADGRRLRTLTVIDQSTRECLAIVVARRLGWMT
jgi:hypothetical protein